MTIGKYVVVCALDAGGQADVYRAVHPTLGKEFVIKLSRKPQPSDHAERDRLVAEGKILAELDHPNLARIHDLDFHNGHAFLAMEYVRGRNLDQQTKLQRLTVRQVAQLLAKLAHCLAVAHRRGIVHQDIKPKNILIDEAGEPRLIDFGMARLRHAWAESPEEPGAVSGTPAFMAPEQARGETHNVTQTSDIFALGAVLYYLLTGKAPFAGSTLRESLDQAARCVFDRSALRSAGVPRSLEKVCLRAMAPEPAKRYSNAEYLARDLQRFVRKSKVRPWIVAAVAGLLIVLAGGVIYLNTGEGQLELRVNEEDIKVTIDGALVRLDSPRDRITIKWPAGKHELEVSKDEFETHTKSFRIFRNGRVELAVNLTPVKQTPETAKGQPSSAITIPTPRKPPDGIAQNVLPGLLPSPDPSLGIGRWQIVTIAPRSFNSAVAWSPDGRWLACVGFGSPIRLLRPDGSTRPVLNTNDAGHANSLSWSPTGKRLVSGGDDTLRMWDIDEGTMEWVALFLPENKIVTISASGDVLYAEPGVLEKELRYLVEAESGAVEALKPNEFRRRVEVAKGVPVK